MKVEQINVGNMLRNFIYVIYDEQSLNAWCIDPYSSAPVLEFLKKNSLELKLVINTHSHFDHIKGNEDLLAQTSAKLWDLSSRKDIELTNNFALKVHEAPGHYPDHVIFMLTQGNQQIGLFAGDVLFHSSVGNCKNGGDVETLYQTIQFIKDITAPETLLYVGHDYGVANMKFASTNSEIDFDEQISQFKNDAKRVFPFARELQFNLFLKDISFNEFQHLRQKRDQW